MKRLAVWIAAVVLMVTVAGCGKKPAQEVKTADITGTVALTYRGWQMEGKLTRYAAGTLEIAVTAPKTLSGVKALWDGETVTLSLGDLAFSVDAEQLPNGGAVKEVIGILDAVLRKEGEQTDDGADLTVKGSYKGNAYTLVCDRETGYPKTLSSDELQLQVTFSQVTAIGQP